jgi:hypothetical protein
MHCSGIDSVTITGATGINAGKDLHDDAVVPFE